MCVCVVCSCLNADRDQAVLHSGYIEIKWNRVRNLLLSRNSGISMRLCVIAEAVTAIVRGQFVD